MGRGWEKGIQRKTETSGYHNSPKLVMVRGKMGVRLARRRAQVVKKKPGDTG